MNHDNSFEYNPSHKECILKNMKIISATEEIIFSTRAGSTKESKPQQNQMHKKWGF